MGTATVANNFYGVNPCGEVLLRDDRQREYAAIRSFLLGAYIDHELTPADYAHFLAKLNKEYSK